MTFSLHSPREPLLSLYRQICVLQARGQIAAATQLAGEPLAHAIESLKATIAITDDELETLFAAEKERVATASVLAEILLPSLTAFLRGAVSAIPDAAVAATPAGSPLPATSSTSSSTSSSGGGSGIADFIDEMLSLERNPPRPARTPVR